MADSTDNNADRKHADNEQTNNNSTVEETQSVGSVATATKTFEDPFNPGPDYNGPNGIDINGKISRRTALLAGGATVGGAVLIGASMREGFSDPLGEAQQHGTGKADDAYSAQDVMYSMCMQCNTFCTIKVRVTDPGNSDATCLVRKIDGNPYSPLTTQPRIPIAYGTSPQEAVKAKGDMPKTSHARTGGAICLKGQAGAQIVHDAKRITQPLRRVGERGSGKWETISWEDAINDIVNGSEKIGTPGFKSWWKYVPQKPVMADWDQVKAEAMSKEDFEAKWGDKLMNPKRPELGPRSNGLAVIGGDRMYLIGEWFAAQVFGTRNRFNHGGTCGVTGVVANARSHPDTGHKRMYADIDFCDYLIVWGTEPLTANKGPTWTAPRITNARARGMKMVVIDPRFTKTAEKADMWVPVKPGYDGDLAFAMARWIIDNKRYDENYLRAPGKAAAATIGEPTWSDATHLVMVDAKGKPKLSTVDMGLAEPPVKDPATGKVPETEKMCLIGGVLTPAHGAPALADLEYDGMVTVPNLGEVHVKTVFTLVKERVSEKTIAEYCEAAGVPESQVVEMATGMTSHGKRAVITSYRGPAMHTNGYDAVRAINYVNFLIGNHDWKGGHITAQKKFPTNKGRYDLAKRPKEAPANKGWGTPITREKSPYEKSSFFKTDGYPAKRRWWAFPGNLCHEVIPSAVEGYPYSLDALFLHRHSPLNSSPGGHRQAQDLKNTEAIKLLVSFDITMGDTSAYCDYVLPDLTYLERFTQESIYPNQQYQLTQMGQPVTLAHEGPRPVEWFYLELAKALELPGVGDNAFGEGAHYNSYEDYWLKMVANIAYAGKNPVPDASPEEIELFVKTRERALGKSFDLAKWQAAVKPEEWPKVVYVLNRGGRFEQMTENHASGYEGEWLKYRYEGVCQFYDEKTAKFKDCTTGKPFDGIAKLRPPMRSDLAAFPDAPLQFVNWKARNQGTHRTINSAWLREVRPTNLLVVNPVDAKPRNLETGDTVEVTSSTGKARGTVFVTETIRPGVVGADAAYGHTGYMAQAIEIDGVMHNPPAKYGQSASKEKYSPMEEISGFAGPRGLGIGVNGLLDDDTLGAHGGVSDPIGGGASQLDTWVEITKVY